jgi:dUTP pyrophosphatase
VKIKIQRLENYPSEWALPQYGTPGAACFDLRATGHYTVFGDKPKAVIPTGLAFEIPEGHVMLMYSRSGHAKRGIRLGNCVGVIDSDYRGEVMVPIHYDFNVPDGLTNQFEQVYYEICFGDAIAQAMVVPVDTVEWEEVDKLSETVRGLAGFGSTGR